MRRVEEFIPTTERRYLVFNNKPYGADFQTIIPEIVYECAKRIESKFFSIDVIKRSDGLDRIVEIGDGQVSDLVGWSAQRFVEIWQ